MIAGGLGYIGSAVVELNRQNTKNEYIILDQRFIPERVAALPPHMKYIQGKIQDLPLMRRLLDDVDILYMLAAEVEAENSIHKSDLVWEQNFEAPKALIENCPNHVRILFPSTGNVFGGVLETEKYMDISEEDEPRPKYPYAETKVAIEKLLKQSKKNYAILRFGTNHGYAPGIRFNLVTNNFFKKALLGEDLPVHGGGENYRPTVCVNDCARALDFLSTRTDAVGEIFHVICENFKIKELAIRVSSILETNSKVVYIAKEVPFNAYALNSDKIRKLGFQFMWNLDSSVKEMAERFHAMMTV